MQSSSLTTNAPFYSSRCKCNEKSYQLRFAQNYYRGLPVKNGFLALLLRNNHKLIFFYLIITQYIELISKHLEMFLGAKIYFQEYFKNMLDKSNKTTEGVFRTLPDI